jgi:2-keto-4-pentenoate hydratase
MNKKTLIEEIINSRLHQIPIDNNNKFIIKSINEAYAIQDIVNEKLTLSGFGKIEGYKIGCTNKVIQKELSINHPILGVFFENKIIKNNSSISLNKFIQAGVECELYAVIGEDITKETPYNYKNINEFISYYGISLEIVENRFENFSDTSAHLIIADGSLGNSIVIGHKIINKDFLNLNELIGRIFLNNKEIYFNKASSILDNPLNALQWYFDIMIELKKDIKKGSKVSLGSITPLIWIREPINVKASIDNIGECNIKFVK